MRGLSTLSDGLVFRAVTGIARAKRGTEAQGSQRNRSVRTTYRSLYRDTVLYRTLSPLCLAGKWHVRHAATGGRLAWMGLRIRCGLARQHVGQDERDHPGYDVEPQEYF